MSWVDNLASNLTGVLGFCVAIFPTPRIDNNECIIDQVNSNIPEIHNYCAAIFFLIISFMSIFLFTRNKEKVIQNWIYIICGTIMLVSTILLILVFFNKVEIAIPHPIFWLETIALFAFGISWTVKGWSFK